MKIARYLVAAVAAAAALGSVTSAQSQSGMTYMQCVRIVEISCGFPFPEDIEVYHQCVNEGIEANCLGLPGSPPG